MAADELGASAARVALDRLNDPMLGAPGIGDQQPLQPVLGRVSHVVGDPGHGGADDHHVRLGHPVRRVGRGDVDRPEPDGLGQPGIVPPDADDASGQAPGADRQADRAADQADADYRHSPQRLQGRFPSTETSHKPFLLIGILSEANVQHETSIP